MYLIGTPVTDRIESAAPPRASPSIFVKIIPVIPIFELNVLPEFTASCPVMASTTRSVSTGDVAFRISSSSLINSSFTASRPAVSRIR